jgi:HSP20 family protein
MADKERDSIQVSEKREVTADAEQTRPGPVFSPAVDIFENPTEITVLADMPGVTAGSLRIDLRDRVLTLEGGVDSPVPEGQNSVVKEYADSGTFFRRFTLSDAIDQAKIEAKLTGGVLRLTLPKVEEAKPRQIRVKTS